MHIFFIAKLALSKGVVASLAYDHKIKSIVKKDDGYFRKCILVTIRLQFALKKKTPVWPTSKIHQIDIYLFFVFGTRENSGLFYTPC